MSVRIHVEINGIEVPLTLDDHAVAVLADALAGRLPTSEPELPLMTIGEAADYLRCSRQRIDDLLSQGRLKRVKEGRRTLLRRDDVDRHLRS